MASSANPIGSTNNLFSCPKAVAEMQRKNNETQTQHGVFNANRTEIMIDKYMKLKKRISN